MTDEKNISIQDKTTSDKENWTCCDV